jgi:hypothetical protein
MTPAVPVPPGPAGLREVLLFPLAALPLVTFPLSRKVIHHAGSWS